MTSSSLHKEFFSIHKLLTPLRLALLARYLISPFLIVESDFVGRHDKSLVMHLPEPAINRCLEEVLCKFGIPNRYRKALSFSDICKPTEPDDVGMSRKHLIKELSMWNTG